MTKVGTVSSLFYSSLSGFTRVVSFALDSKGIIGDKHYNKNIDRSVLMSSLESYTLASDNEIDVSYGVLGENILMDYNPYNLSTGSRIKIGNVTLEISQPCTLCKSLGKTDSKLPVLLKNHRGIFAKVIEAGKIYEGDSIYLLA